MLQITELQSRLSELMGRNSNLEMGTKESMMVSKQPPALAHTILL